MANSRCPGGPLLFVRTRGPLTPRRLLLSSPPTLDWVLLGVRGRRTPSPRGPLLVRRGEVLPETGALILDTRPTLQGILGPHTRISRIEVKGYSMGRGGGRQSNEEREWGAQRDEGGQGKDWGPQSTDEREWGAQRDEGGQGKDRAPQSTDEREQGAQRDEGGQVKDWGPQSTDEREWGAQRDEGGQGKDRAPQSTDEREQGAQRDEGGQGKDWGPQSTVEREQGAPRDEGGPPGEQWKDGPQSTDEREWGGQGKDWGPQSTVERKHGAQAHEGGPPGGQGKDWGPQSTVERKHGAQAHEGGPPGGQGKDWGPQSTEETEWGSQRDEGGPPGGKGKDVGPQSTEETEWEGQWKKVRGPQRPLVGALYSGLLVDGSGPDPHSPLVSSFARVPLPLRLRVAPIDAESLVRTGRLQEVGGPVDRSTALWVSRKQLRVLGLYHREWVWVSLPARGDRGRHLAMIVAADLWLGHPHKYNHLLSSPCLASREESPYPGSGTAVISATLAFNLTGGSSSVSDVLIQRFSTEPTREGRSALVEPPIAALLHVDVVKSPAYSSEATFQQALCQHFQTPRAVQVGDVLCVSCLSNAECQLNKSQIPVRCPDLYFKVQKIEGEPGSDGYMASSGHTTLYQVGSVCSFIPSFPSRDGHVFWSSLFPAGLSHAVDDIYRLLLPHLQNSSDVLGAGGRVLLVGPKGSGKTTVVRAACSRLNVHLYQVECARLCRDNSAGSISRLRSVFSRAQDCRPCVLLLCHLDLLGKERDASAEDPRVISALCSLLLGGAHTQRELPFLVVATTCRAQEVPLDLQSCFLHEVSLSAPTEEQRLSLLTVLTAPIPLSRDVDLAHLARRTVGFVVGDLCALLSRAGSISCTRMRNSCALSEEDEEGLLAAGFPVTSQDLDCALAELQEAHSEALGAPKVPCVHWTDVGGLEHAKRQLLDTVQFPLEHPEMLALGLSRSGILLYGPPGTGKTLLAKAVATECAMTFLSVKGPELINMYVGQSEENVREVFSRAQAASPCIIFFDELDSLAPNRGRSADSGGVMDRVVSQLLAEMDGLHSSRDVFVIGATNRPDLLDPALLRPGRFDKLVYVGLNENRESQLKVLEAITRRFSLGPGVDLSRVLHFCPAALTGADLYALCADAMMSAIKEKVQRLQEGADEAVSELVLRMEHLVQAAERLQPSVSQRELQRYEGIHRQFSVAGDGV